MAYNADRKLRAFLAFDPPEQVAGLLADARQKMAGQGVDLKWVRPANIHLTVKFFGDIPAAGVDRINRAVAATLPMTVPMTLSLKGLGVFPNWKRPRVLWAGLTGDIGPLRDFQAGLDNALAAEGFEKDDRSFKAHLTIGRARKTVNNRALAEAVDACGIFPEIPWSLKELILYKSELKPGGAVYTVLNRFLLTGQGGPASDDRRP